MEDTKLLVSGAGASQEKLAQAAQSSVSTITKLADVVKLGAASLGSEDPETQVQNSVQPEMHKNKLHSSKKSREHLNHPYSCTLYNLFTTK